MLTLSKCPALPGASGFNPSGCGGLKPTGTVKNWFHRQRVHRCDVRRFYGLERMPVPQGIIYFLQRAVQEQRVHNALGISEKGGLAFLCFFFTKIRYPLGYFFLHDALFVAAAGEEGEEKDEFPRSG